MQERGVIEPSVGGGHTRARSGTGRRVKQLKSVRMSETSAYVPPGVWTSNKPSGRQLTSVNRPIAGATLGAELSRMPSNQHEGTLQDDRGPPLASMRIPTLRETVATATLLMSAASWAHCALRATRSLALLVASA